MNKLKEELFATDLALWRKKGVFISFAILSLLPFFIMYVTTQSELEDGLWQLRYFIAIAFTQAVAQMSLAWYMLKNRVPNYVILSLSIMFIFSQLTFCITVILISNA